MEDGRTDKHVDTLTNNGPDRQKKKDETKKREETMGLVDGQTGRHALTCNRPDRKEDKTDGLIER